MPIESMGRAGAELAIREAEARQQARANALQVAFQVIGSNPGVLRDPNVRRTYFKLLEATGVNPMEIYDEETPSIGGTIQELAQRGGSLARTPAQPVPQVSSVPTAV